MNWARALVSVGMICFLYRHMVKIFRKNRMQIFDKKSFGNYLLYAVGEIVLVVIGILIALNINNWNEEKKKASKRQELLIGMTKDLAQDIAGHDRMIGFYQNRLDFFGRHLPKTDFSSTPTDTLFMVFDANAGAFNIADQSYQKAKHLGIGQLCSDDSLAVRIDQYYTQSAGVTKLLFEYDFDQTEKANEFWMMEQDGLEFAFNSSVQIPVLQDSTERRNQALELISSPKGRNSIKLECQIKEIMLGYNTGVRSTAQQLLDDIEAYIAN